jgi:hypothetical protein
MIVDDRCKCIVTEGQESCRWCQPQQTLDDALQGQRVLAMEVEQLKQQLAEVISEYEGDALDYY